MHALVRKLSNKGPKLTRKQGILVTQNEERRNTDQNLPQTASTEAESGFKVTTQNENHESVPNATDGEQKIPAPSESLPGPDIEASLSETPARFTPAEPVPATVTDQPSHLFGVLVHYTDRLKPDLAASHPIVKVHVVDVEHGNNVKKSGRRPVSYSSENDSITEILPLMTQTPKHSELIQKQNYMINGPSWEELLIFNEDYDYLANRNSVVLFFELLNFLSMSALQSKIKQQNQRDGWHHIAWAFLRIRPNENSSNCGKHVRLQLYRPPRSAGIETVTTATIFEWWKTLPRIKYPSSLHVTIKMVKPSKNIPIASRSLYSIQPEAIQDFSDGSIVKLDSNQNEISSTEAEIPVWKRLPGQPCKIPNNCELIKTEFKEGSTRIFFSPNGRFLAASGNGSQNKFPIVLFEVPLNQRHKNFIGHSGFIYDLAFSNDSSALASASADGTAKIWDIASRMCVNFLPHPTFVYAVKFMPNQNSKLVTGAFDKLIRIWHRSLGLEAELIQTVAGHEGYVNCLNFSTHGSVLFSGDSNGILRLWKFEEVEIENSAESKITRISCIQRIVEESAKGIPIDSVVSHPSERSAVLQFRDGTTRILDLRSKAYNQRLQLPAPNSAKLPMRCCISACGKYCFTGTDKGTVYVWNLETGKQVAVYDFKITSPVIDIAFHPMENMIAFALYGECQPVIVYGHDSGVAPLESEEISEIAPVQIERANDQKDYANFNIEKLLQQHKLLTQWESKFTMPTFPSTEIDENLKSVENNLETEPGSENQKIIESKKMKSQSLISKFQSQKGILKSSNVSSAPMIEKPRVENNGVEKAENFRAIAQFNYKGQNADEISFNRGDTVFVIKRDDSDWWIGFVDPKKTGYFPANYVLLQ